MDAVTHTAKQTRDIQEVYVVVWGFEMALLEGLLQYGVEELHFFPSVRKECGVKEGIVGESWKVLRSKVPSAGLALGPCPRPPLHKTKHQ